MVVWKGATAEYKIGKKNYHHFSKGNIVSNESLSHTGMWYKGVTPARSGTGGQRCRHKKQLPVKYFFIVSQAISVARAKCLHHDFLLRIYSSSEGGFLINSSSCLKMKRRFSPACECDTIRVRGIV
jgi:hypothetical protein